MSKLPVLMYHNVSDKSNLSFGLTISTENLEKQFSFLVKNQYTSFHLAELENLESIPAKSIVITFDDCTVNQLEFAIPLLEKFNLKATFFIPFFYIGKSDLWNNGQEPIMNIETLKALNSRIELGFHSFAHSKYTDLSAIAIQQDFNECNDLIQKHDLKVFNAIAYPFGNYPKKEPVKSVFFNILQVNNIKMGLKIGNKINKFPFKNPYEINRIDILGQDSLFFFKLKLIFGKLKLF